MQKSSTMQPLTGSLSSVHTSACANSDVSARALCSTVGKDKLKSRVSQVHLCKHHVLQKIGKSTCVVFVFLTRYYPYSIRDRLSLSLMNSKWFYWLGECVDDTVCMSSDQSMDHNRSLTRSSTGLFNKKTSYKFCFQI